MAIVIYPGGDHQFSPNLHLGLWGTDEVTTDNFLLIDAAFGAVTGTVDVNGVAVPAPANFINSASVTFSVVGSNISLTATGGSGTVTSFSAGNLSPLFTTAVATPTTTPALTFALNTQSSGTVFAGPATGPAATPTFRALVASDIPALPYLPASTVLPATFAPVANEFLTGYSSVTGAFSAAQPSFSNLSGSISLLQTPLTTAGDTLYANNTPALARLPIGTTGQTLTVVAGLPAWATPTTGTVTSFSAGALSPLFTTSVATATTTPALTFTLASSLPGTVLNNPTAISASPVYTAAPVLGLNGTTNGTLGLATSTTSGATITIDNLGALTAYAFNLPTTVGAAGSVLTSQAGGATSMTWTTQAALGVAWSSLTSATANLSLSNAAFTTTFNQTSATAWLWYNTTTGTVGTTNASPLLELAANYFNVSSLQDTWTLQSSLAAGTNAASTLTVAHSGSTGNVQVVLPTNANSTIPALTFSGQTGTGIGGNTSTGVTLYIGRGNVLLYDINDTVTVGVMGSTGNGAMFQVITGHTGETMQVGATVSQVNAFTANNLTFLSLGSTAAYQGTGAGFQTDTQEASTFSPASGSTSFNAFFVAPTINQTGTATGSYTALKVNVTETAALGTYNLLLDTQVGTVSKFAVTNKGHVQAGAPSGTLNKDLAGQATITAAGTTVAVTFTANYTGTGQPIIVITPTSDPLAAGVPVGYWVTYSGGAGAWTGFTVNIQTALLANVTFNYIVIGQP